MNWNIFKILKDQEGLSSKLVDPILLQHEKDSIQSKIDRLEREKSFIFQLLGTFITFIAVAVTIIFSIVQNNRENEDYILRSRPYLVISSIGVISQQTPVQKDFRIKNVGTLPAIFEGGNISCESTPLRNFSEKNIIGNGEEIILSFSPPTSSPTIKCQFEINYSVPSSNFSDKKYKTLYEFEVRDGKPYSVGASLE